MKKSPFIFLSLALSFAFLGCAQKKGIKAEAQAPVLAAATPEPTLEPRAEVASPEPLDAHYIVRPGDSLWTISAKDNVMGDSMRWPLLYKQNRDQIVDPDLIEAQQDLSYRKVMTSAEVSDAVQKAKETPPYSPHSAPRKALPLKY